jgi:hypothetical protein
VLLLLLIVDCPVPEEDVVDEKCVPVLETEPAVDDRSVPCVPEEPLSVCCAEDDVSVDPPSPPVDPLIVLDDTVEELLIPLEEWAVLPEIELAETEMVDDDPLLLLLDDGEGVVVLLLEMVEEEEEVTGAVLDDDVVDDPIAEEEKEEEEEEEEWLLLLLEPEDVPEMVDEDEEEEELEWLLLLLLPLLTVLPLLLLL